MRPRLVALAVLVVVSVLASGCLSVVTCRVTGYEKHTATFEAPGLFNTLSARADTDPRVRVRENALPGGLPVDDPDVARELEGLALRQVDWLGPDVESLDETLELTSASVHATGPRTANVTVTAVVGAGDNVSALREDVRDAFDAFADVPRGDREALVDEVLGALADRNERLRSVSVIVDPAWLKVGTVYARVLDEDASIIRHPGAGEVHVAAGDFAFYLRSIRYAHFEAPGDAQVFEILAHSDGVVDAFRNRSPRGEDPPRMSDAAFLHHVGDLVREFGVESAAWEDARVEHKCRAP